MRVVSPYRPYRADERWSPAHKRLGAYDWIAALRYLAVSVEASCHCETVALTDVGVDLGVPSFGYPTTARELMPWILEIALRYLESADFDQDTVLISPDVLVYQDLRPWFTADLGLVTRFGDKYVEKPILNSVQWWKVSAKAALVAFYQRAFDRALTLSSDARRWGGDTEPLVTLLGPVARGRWTRQGLTVQFIDRVDVHEELSTFTVRCLERGIRVRPTRAVLDFKYERKRHLAAVFQATYGRDVRTA